MKQLLLFTLLLTFTASAFEFTGKVVVALGGWFLQDKANNVYGLAGTVAANGKRVITMKSNSMPLNNDGDTILLVQGKTVRQTVSYNKKQAGDGAVVKVGEK